jgi:hypothetical protein
MKKFFSILVLMGFMAAPLVSLGFGYAESKNAEFGLNRAAPEAMLKYQLGTKVMRDTQHELKATYDFAKIGGASGTYNLRNIYANKLTLPKNALVTNCYIDVLTAPVGAGASLAFSTGKSAGDLKGATAVASFTGVVACIPVETAATVIKLTADVNPTITISGGTLTAGKINVHMMYLLSE